MKKRMRFGFVFAFAALAVLCVVLLQEGGVNQSCEIFLNESAPVSPSLNETEAGVERSKELKSEWVSLRPDRSEEKRELDALGRVDEQMARLTFSIPGFLRSEGVVPGMEQIKVSGMSNAGEEGKPELPKWDTLIPVPNGAAAVVYVADSSSVILENFEIQPHQRLMNAERSDKAPLDVVVDATIYQTDAFFPETICSVAPPVIDAGTRKTFFQVCPFQYNPVTKQLKVYTALEVEIRFEGSDSRNAMPSRRKTKEQSVWMRNREMNCVAIDGMKMLPKKEEK